MAARSCCGCCCSTPEVELVQATSREPGRRLDQVQPGLRGLTELVLSPSEPAALDPDLDAVFLALPHGSSGALAPAIRERCPRARLYDLAQDFRVGWESEGWTYGQPELFREAVAAARQVACPGCFATAILLATGPALRAGLCPRHIVVDAKTGSSGSGASPKPLTHHPLREATVKAYKVFEHQHEAEIQAAWGRLAGPRPLPALSFVPQSVPLVRGIYACCYLVFEGESPAGLEAAYRETFAGSPFVRVLAEPPNVAEVRGTNNADLFVREHCGVTLVIAAIDNLVRGAAGQAVQCMNLGFGLPEDCGLRLAALLP
ncbi:MAG: N-acetyl-gamma-glutamyl-phosphate reductase [Planctomycetota bacterium]|nr:MAG: N-acetyl-gamma-glutamyl-phosphate reductase [Planctomycetota bacterium]